MVQSETITEGFSTAAEEPKQTQRARGQRAGHTEKMALRNPTALGAQIQTDLAPKPSCPLAPGGWYWYPADLKAWQHLQPVVPQLPMRAVQVLPAFFLGLCEGQLESKHVALRL